MEKSKDVCDPCNASTNAFSGAACGLQLCMQQGRMLQVILQLSFLNCCQQASARSMPPAEAVSTSWSKFLHGENTSVKNKEPMGNMEA